MKIIIIKPSLAILSKVGVCYRTAKSTGTGKTKVINENQDNIGCSFRGPDFKLRRHLGIAHIQFLACLWNGFFNRKNSPVNTFSGNSVTLIVSLFFSLSQDNSKMLIIKTTSRFFHINSIIIINFF